MVKRKRGNTLEKWEIGIVKAMLEKFSLNDQEILAYFTRPTRTINHRLIGEIRSETKHKSLKASSQEKLDEFLEIWPNLDEATGLNIKGDELLIKSREAMIAAVSTYNTAVLKFKSELFIVTATIAWTYLFHYWFSRSGIDFRYKDKESGVVLKTKEGADKFWELSACIENKKLPILDGIYKNLKFMIDLRNEIEHRSTNRIDDAVSAKFQANCINFDKWISDEFGERYAVHNHLSLALQFSSFDIDQKNLLKSAENFPENISAMIAKFEDALTDDQLRNSEFAYRVFFVKRTSNRKGKADRAIEVIPSDSKDFEAAELAYLKEIDKKRYPASDVVKIINSEGYKKFNISNHTALWKALKARDPQKAFGRVGDYKNSWVWYENWLERVRSHCEENKDKYT